MWISPVLIRRVEGAADHAVLRVLDTADRWLDEMAGGSAETVLDALLADGDWHESDGLKKLLAAAGFNDRLAKRAAKDLGVEYERRGFPASTWWRLPAATSLVGTSTTPTNVPTVETAYPSGSAPAAAPVGTVGTSNGEAGGLPAGFDRLEAARRFDAAYPPRGDA